MCALRPTHARRRAGDTRCPDGPAAGLRPALRLVVLSLLSCSFSLRSAEISEPAPLAAHSLLLDVARAGGRLVAAGAFGNVVVSTDEGATWTQVIVPARALLTGVSFPDPQHGWIVGHDGVILATADGGTTWVRQDSGKDLDTVYLDVLFLDAQRGFAVGAYGAFRATADGGRTWTARKPAPDDFHYNCIAASPAGQLYLAGESGTLLVSDDGGDHWTRSATPYDGSLFAIVPPPPGGGPLVVAGLRGHVLVSAGRGAGWREFDADAKVLLMGGTRPADGSIVLAGQGGNFLVSRDDGRSFSAWKPAGLGTSAAQVIATTDGALVAVGETGATRLKLP